MDLKAEIERIVTKIKGVEGGYGHNADDLGGATRFGITEEVARRHGWTGRMQDLPKSLSREIFIDDYIIGVSFDRVIELSPMIGEELVDTGVNMGQSWGALFLQQWLNVFNNKGEHWADLVADGFVGDKTITALRKFLTRRGAEGEKVMTAALNCSQGERYKDLALAREANETFAYGWMLNRVTKQWPNLNSL
jgi:lysozyme family protein